MKVEKHIIDPVVFDPKLLVTIDKYYPDRNQVSLFSEISSLSEEEVLVLAYRQRNADIGYHIQRDEEK